MPDFSFDFLLSKVEKNIGHASTHRHPISPSQRLAITLHILAAGDSFQSAGMSYRMSKCSVQRIFHEACKAINPALMDEFLPIPSEETLLKIACGFEERWNFPNCLGAIDGKHVVMRCPPLSGSNYFNYKHTFSINLIAVVDHDYCFTAVDIGAPGRESDGGVFRRSKFGIGLKKERLDIPAAKNLPGTSIIAPHVFVTDDALPLWTSIMKPYPRGCDYSMKVFNYRLSRARNVVENAFGILVARWRIFSKPVCVQTENCKQLVMTCILLHNFLHRQDRATAPHQHSPLPCPPILLGISP